MIPKDPVMLLSYLNLKLRDQYQSIEELCEELGLEQDSIQTAMEGIAYRYDRVSNQFK